jgi:uncharacterized protein (TIGR00725 family)
VNRRPIVSVVGSSEVSAEVAGLCRELGRLAIEAGYRVATGGLGGVMSHVCEGARAAAAYREGDTIGVLPSYDASAANPHVDIAVPSGIGVARNVLLVAMADAVVAVAGGSGTLSEMAIAWQLDKPVIALCPSGGWAADLAGRAIDGRRDDRVEAATDAADAIRLVALRLAR